MKDTYTNQEKEIIDALQGLKDVPDRQHSQITRGKAAFLAEAKQIADQSAIQPVSISLFQRLINSFTQPKPQLRLSTLTVSIILVSVLLVTFSGSVYAARYALPDQTLYPYKLWLEDRRLSITSKTDSQIDLHLAFADERLREYQELGIGLDDPLADQVFENYNGHIEDANRLLAANDEIDEHLDELKDLEDRYEKIFDREDDEDPENSDGSDADDLDETDLDDQTDDVDDSQEQREDNEKEGKKSDSEASNKQDKSDDSSDDNADTESDKSDEPADEKDDGLDEPDEPDDEKDSDDEADEPDDPEKTPEPDEPDDDQNDELDP